MYGYRVKLDTDFTNLHRLWIIPYLCYLSSVLCHLSSVKGIAGQLRIKHGASVAYRNDENETRQKPLEVN